MENKDTPAMPLTGDILNDLGMCVTESLGLTKREYFAAKAMQGLLAQSNGSAISSDCNIGADYCLKMADALLKALEE